MLLAPTYLETSFVIDHINELELNVCVMWLGNNLQEAIDILQEKWYTNKVKNKTFLFLYYTPSEVVDYSGKFDMITMPRCELMMSSIHTTCVYDLSPYMKYSSESLKQYTMLHSSVIGVNFAKSDIEYILKEYNSRIRKIINKNHIIKSRENYWDHTEMTIEDNFNEIACAWMKDKKNESEEWQKQIKTTVISIGGIFPINVPGNIYSGNAVVDVFLKFSLIIFSVYILIGIADAAEMAVAAVNKNPKILTNYNLQLIKMDGQCRTDVVLNAFIRMLTISSTVLGVLGPACSETVEPIASKLLD